MVRNDTSAMVIKSQLLMIQVQCRSHTDDMHDDDKIRVQVHSLSPQSSSRRGQKPCSELVPETSPRRGPANIFGAI